VFRLRASVGAEPVLAGGKLLGFTGVLLAVPLAASVAVIIRRALTYYRSSDFFVREPQAYGSSIC
jgi:predicted PurR-regulated permease PerM